jgi:hypothetical protein
MSCNDRDDFTVFVILRKKDKDGKDLMHLNFPFSATPITTIDEIPAKDQASLNLHLGSSGILRASHRRIDAARSIHPQFPFHPHKIQEKVPPGTIVRLEVGIWAMGVDFEAGESISVRVCISLSIPSSVKHSLIPGPRSEVNSPVSTNTRAFLGRGPIMS